MVAKNNRLTATEIMKVRIVKLINSLSFIGISVTLVVGYQIYNAVELKQKINAVEKLKIAIEQQQKRLKSLEIEQKEGFEIIQSRVFRNARMYIDAFIHIHAAIVYSLSVNHTSDGFSWLMKDLKFCMLGITSLSFRRCFKEYEEYDFPNKIAELRKIFQDDKNKIIVAMPTGTGKSLVIAEYINLLTQWFPDVRILMITHKMELIWQNKQQLNERAPNINIGVSQGWTEEKYHISAKSCINFRFFAIFRVPK